MHAASRRLLPFLVVVLAGSPSLLRAQGEPSESERRKAAKKEQAEERKRQAEEEAAAARAEEEAAETGRLKKAGIAEAPGPLEDQKGFYVELDGLFTEASGAERAVATTGDVVSSASTAEQLDSDSDGLPDAFTIQGRRDLTLEYDSAVAPRLELGWRTGTHGVVAARYWTTSQDGSASAAIVSSFPSSAGGPTLTVGGIDNQGFENAAGSYATDPAAFDRPLGSPRQLSENRLHGAESVVASGTLETTRLDLTYSKTALVRKRFEVWYRVGLTIADVKRVESARFTWRSFSSAEVADNLQSVETVTATSDGSGVGPMAGAAARFRLGAKDRLGVRIGVEVAGLRAKHDLAFRDATVRSSDTLPPQGEVPYQDTTSDGASDLLSILEGDLALEGRIGGRVRLAVGYRTSTWRHALVEQRYPDAANLALLEEGTSDVRFSGPYFRVGVFF
jgi:hypothetical protein